MATATKLSNLQQEILKTFSFNINDDDLNAIKDFLVKYFSEKAKDEADRIWKEKGLTSKDMENWLNEES